MANNPEIVTQGQGHGSVVDHNIDQLGPVLCHELGLEHNCTDTFMTAPATLRHTHTYTDTDTHATLLTYTHHTCWSFRGTQGVEYNLYIP